MKMSESNGITLIKPTNQRATQNLSYYNNHTFSLEHVVPGEPIGVESGFLKGHGTKISENELTATVAGIVERVSKLVSVKPIKSRYHGEVGDIVVGRITEVGQKRWKVDIGGRQDAVLLLSAINLPGIEFIPKNIKRKRNQADELQMRTFFAENSLISGEVREFFGDGTMMLHTRNTKYGKLSNGVFVSVSPNLIRRSKSHFLTLGNPVNLDVILGNNGYIWITKMSKQLNSESDSMFDFQSEENSKSEDPQQKLEKEKNKLEKFQDSENCSCDITVRKAISRVRNSILVLDQINIQIHTGTIMLLFQKSLEMALTENQICLPKFVKKAKKLLSNPNKNKQQNDMEIDNKFDDNINNQSSDDDPSDDDSTNDESDDQDQMIL